MRIVPTNGVWTHTTMNAVQMARVEMFYFTEQCSGCHRESILGLELEQGDIRFRCPRCSAEVDHDRVMACDKDEMEKFGWAIRSAE
jgi:DNA-directed RNA polymerase subunit RPC12/RpoP